MNLNILKNNNENNILQKRDGDLGFDLIAASAPNVDGELYAFFDGFAHYKSVSYIEYDTGLVIEPEKDVIYYSNNGSLYMSGVEKINHSLVFPRSSISKYNLTLKNSVAIIDQIFRGSVRLRFSYVFQPQDLIVIDGKVYGKIDYNKIYKKGDKIGQLVTFQENNCRLQYKETLTDTARQDGGFGSTGK